MIELYTSPTPNGHKISIMLEELAIPYHVTPIDLSAKTQKEPWFLALNPNGRIPVIVDTDNNNFAVFESGAILIYLAEKYRQLLPVEPTARSATLQWLMFQMSGVGPMQGQAHVFCCYAPEKIPYAIERYRNEVYRLYHILNHRLAEAPYLAGPEHSIADIATYPWVAIHEHAQFNIDGLPHLQQWLKTLSQRPAYQRGMDVPPREESKLSTAERAAKVQSILE